MINIFPRAFDPLDVLRLSLQASQHIQAGEDHASPSLTDAIALDANGPCWSVETADHTLLACGGFRTLFTNDAGEPVHGLAWAMLSSALTPRGHVWLRSFVRELVVWSPLRRIECYTHASNRGECAWAKALGFGNPQMLRHFGAASETVILWERLR